MISTKKKKRSTKSAEIMCTICNDAKRGTLSAWSWPSREVVYLKRKNLYISDFNGFKTLKGHEGDLQYVTPTNYSTFRF